MKFTNNPLPNDEEFDSIKSKVVKLSTQVKKQQGKLNKLTSQLQEKCTHPNLEGTYGSNTGNYCPQDDSYWIAFKCPDCGYYKTVYDNDPDWYEYSRVKFIKK